jgi:AcrR family transcriptional regulator
VVEGGLLVFARTGYTAASMADIADASGVTRAVVYDHFSSKKDLYVAVLGEQGALFLGHLETRIVSEDSPRERMRSTMDAVLAFAEDHPTAWQLLNVNTTYGDAEAEAAWQQAWAERSTRVVDLLTPDIERLGLTPDQVHLDLVVQMLMGALTQSVHWWGGQSRIAREAVIAAGMALMWDGLGHLGG